ncbi:MAG: hypothetical protein ABSG83_14860 [Roseiarcus sp.]
MPDPARSDPAVPASRAAASASAIQRELRRRRIMERAQRGWSYDLIAEGEDLAPRRVRQIVRRTLTLREIDPAGERAAEPRAGFLLPATL